jgi:hypothetical protein
LEFLFGLWVALTVVVCLCKHDHRGSKCYQRGSIGVGRIGIVSM